MAEFIQAAAVLSVNDLTPHTRQLGACPSNAPFWTGQPVRVVVPMPHG